MKTKKSSILGPDGAPVEIGLLSGEIAAPEMFGQRALVYYTEANGLTPGRLGEIMRSANHGLARPYLTLAIDMEERYLHYASQLQTRRQALDGLTASISAPKGVNAKAVDLAQSLVDDPIFADMVADLQDGVGKGYSVVEPIWEFENNALRPVDFKWRDQRYFRYDMIGLTDLHLLDESGLPGLKAQAPYFITHEPKIRAGLPVRRGLARSAAWAFIMQNFALQDWAAFCEVYGMPLRLGKYNNGANMDERATLLRAVRDIGSDAAAIIPETMAMEFVETNGNRGEAVFGHLISYLDRKVSMMVVGQTMTAEDGASLAQARVHENVFHGIVRADARQTAATLNRDLLHFMIAMNLGPQEIYPDIELKLPVNEDLKALGDFLQKTVPMGLKVGQKFVRERASIPEPEKDEETLGAPTTIVDEQVDETGDKPGDKPGAKDKNKAAQLGACPHCGEQHASLGARSAPGQPLAQADAIDALIDDGASDWEAQLDPLVKQVLAAANESSGFEAFAKKLAELAPDMDTGLLMKRLALAQMKARGLGDAGGRDA